MNQVNQGGLAEDVINKILSYWKEKRVICDFVHAAKGGQLDYAGVDFIITIREGGPQIFLQIKSSSHRHLKGSINDHRRLHPLVELIFVLNRFPKNPLHNPPFLERTAAYLKKKINKFICKKFKGRVLSI